MLRKVLPLTMVSCLVAALLVVSAPVYAGGDPGASGADGSSATFSATNPTTAAPKTVGVLRTTDPAQLNRYVPMAYELKHANPYVVSYFIGVAVGTEAGLMGTYVNTGEGATGGIILVAVPEYMLQKIGDVVKQLDRPMITTSSGNKWQYLQMNHRSIIDADIADNLLQYGANDNSIFTDVETNSFLVQGSPAGTRYIIDALAEYDIPTPQVSLSTKIYEVNASNDGTLGLDYVSWKNSQIGQELFGVAADGYVFKDSNDNIGRRYAYSSSYRVEYPSQFVDFLVVKGQAQVVNDGRVTVLSSETAGIAVVDQVIYYYETNVDDTQNGSGREVAPAEYNTPDGETLINVLVDNIVDREPSVTNTFEIEEEREGIFMEVTPVIAKNAINIDVTTQISDFHGFDDQGVPQMRTQRIDTTCRTVNGREVVLGKMTRTREVKTTRKVPILGSLPVIGYVFGGEITKKEVTKVVEVLTPTIIENGGLTEDELETIDQTAGGKKLELPNDEYFFEQYGLDN